MRTSHMEYWNIYRNASSITRESSITYFGKNADSHTAKGEKNPSFNEPRKIVLFGMEAISNPIRCYYKATRRTELKHFTVQEFGDF